MSENLPPFPVDDLTLDAIEHALDATLSYDRPADADPADEGPWLIGADYSLATLLDFLAGTMGRDPNEELIQAARDERDIEIVYDTRIHYSERDLIRALVAEIRRLRSHTA